MSYSRLLFHIVFRPKYSERVLTPEHSGKLYAYMRGYIQNRGCMVYAIGGMADHIHLLVQLPTTLAIADFVRDLKTTTHKFINDNNNLFPYFHAWTRSYCAISVSASRIPAVTHYIENQAEHHKKFSFYDELLAICREYNIDVNPQYFLKD